MRVDDVSKSGVYRARALECRKLAEMATPGTGGQYERLAIAYEQLAEELERRGLKPLRLRLEE